jgi:hypothetical protein
MGFDQAGQQPVVLLEALVAIRAPLHDHPLEAVGAGLLPDLLPLLPVEAAVAAEGLMNTVSPRAAAPVLLPAPWPVRLLMPLPEPGLLPGQHPAADAVVPGSMNVSVIDPAPG